MLNSVIDFLNKFFSPEMIVLSIASMPISELRGAIPVGVFYYKFSLIKTFALAFVGNLIPVFPIIYFLEKFSRFLSVKYGFFEKFFEWLFARTRKRGKNVEKYGLIGLTLFVAIPLPYTGAWTGSVLAFLFGFDKKVSFLFITIGVFIAGIIVSVLSLGIKSIC